MLGDESLTSSMSGRDAIHYAKLSCESEGCLDISGHTIYINTKAIDGIFLLN